MQALARAGNTDPIYLRPAGLDPRAPAFRPSLTQGVHLRQTSQSSTISHGRQAGQGSQAGRGRHANQGSQMGQ